MTVHDQRQRAEWPGRLDPADDLVGKAALIVLTSKSPTGGDMSVANLKAGEEFSPGFRVRKLVNTEIWSLTWATDGRALFRYGSHAVPGETHIIWETIGTHDETYGQMP